MDRVSSRAIRVALASVLVAACGCGFVTLRHSARAETQAAANAPADLADLNATDDPDDLAKYGRLEEHIRAAAQRDRIAPSVVDALIRIFADDIDLQRVAHPGDGFVVVTDDAKSGSNIVFASLTFGGQTEQFYRYATPGGDVDYFDRSGRSADKVMIRRPLRDGRLRSPFGMMRHPILGYTRMHTGVDWEAPLGTPIFAAGAGTVETAGSSDGYGETVRLRHSRGYATTYAHLSTIAGGLAPGVKVERGQVIGAVGSTGLSTGPHLHYEVVVDGRFVDPMRITLPAQRVLAGATLAAFTGQRVEADSSRSASFHLLLPGK
jgi:murein DD-endopeptidase MepM/ murein hydrolase activator NlpD